MSDPVNRPDHYTAGDIECIDAIRAALSVHGFRDFCRGQVIKYTWRAGKKHDGEEDLRKAVWYGRMANGDDPRDDLDRDVKTDGVKSPTWCFAEKQQQAENSIVKFVCSLAQGHAGQHWCRPLTGGAIYWADDERII